MERRSRSPESPGRRRGRREYSSRRRSRSWSRSRSRDKSRDRRRRHSRSPRSRSRERIYNRRSSPDLYKDLIDQDYQVDRDRYHRTDRRSRDRDRRGKDRHYRRGQTPDNYFDDVNSNDSFDSDQVNNSEHYRNQAPSNKIIILGLAQHITEADINNDLIHYGLQPLSIRLIRKRKTGASRGFAFVEFNTELEAIRWMEFKQGVLMVQDQYRAVMQYTHVKEAIGKDKIVTDWYCAKCGVFNFKRRENCFKCYASREESEKGGEGSDEVSNILTKKIMLRNLDVLTNEEGVLTVMQEVVPTLVSKISKILICRDPLTSTSRGICYLSFDNLIDSMNLHNALKESEPPIQIDNREILVSYCVDSENKQITKGPSTVKQSNHHNNRHHHSSDVNISGYPSSNTHEYTLADVPRLAEYSASMYASTTAEHDHYLKYYTDYYIGQISKGHYTNLPTMNQIGQTANSGAAVALSAIQRKQKQHYKNSGSHNSHHHHHQQHQHQQEVLTQPSIAIDTPTGTDNKKYATPDISYYQFDATSGYYYDPITGLYYEASSQYYYNKDTGAYLYWNPEKSTYILAPQNVDETNNDSNGKLSSAIAAESSSIPAAPPAPTISIDPSPSVVATSIDSKSSSAAIDQQNIYDNDKKDKTTKSIDGISGGGKPDKVKVAKKIVKDMEKWAKQLNQKKDMNMLQPQLQSQQIDEQPTIVKHATRSGGYADVGFSILENKERIKIAMDGSSTIGSVSHINKLVSSYGSDSDNEQNDHQSHHHHHHQSHSSSTKINSGDNEGGAGGVYSTNENDYIDFDKLTCLLCKRAFQSLDILNKHLKMSNLHRENLQKYNLTNGHSINSANNVNNPESQAYRDRAKERRLKYGECDPPPPNRSRERFEKEIEKHTAALQKQSSNNLASVPIGENNVGNRLLQKMGWSEGQGLGRTNQGRTNIIEAESRAPAAGLGTKTTNFAPGDDYKSYIKRMMKTRYEQVD